MVPFDVVLAPVMVGMANYPRWCIVLEVDGDTLTVLPCSTQVDTYYRAGSDLLFDDDDASMDAAGFKAPSFVRENMPTQLVHRAKIRKTYGHLTPDQEQRFKEWFGWQVD